MPKRHGFERLRVNAGDRRLPGYFFIIAAKRMRNFACNQRVISANFDNKIFPPFCSRLMRNNSNGKKMENDRRCNNITYNFVFDQRTSITNGNGNCRTGPTANIRFDPFPAAAGQGEHAHARQDQAAGCYEHQNAARRPQQQQQQQNAFALGAAPLIPGTRDIPEEMAPINGRFEHPLHLAATFPVVCPGDEAAKSPGQQGGLPGRGGNPDAPATSFLFPQRRAIKCNAPIAKVQPIPGSSSKPEEPPLGDSFEILYERLLSHTVAAPQSSSFQEISIDDINLDEYQHFLANVNRTSTPSGQNEASIDVIEEHHREDNEDTELTEDDGDQDLNLNVVRRRKRRCIFESSDEDAAADKEMPESNDDDDDDDDDANGSETADETSSIEPDDPRDRDYRPSRRQQRAINASRTAASKISESPAPPTKRRYLTRRAANAVDHSSNSRENAPPINMKNLQIRLTRCDPANITNNNDQDNHTAASSSWSASSNASEWSTLTTKSMYDTESTIHSSLFDIHSDTEERDKLEEHREEEARAEIPQVAVEPPCEDATASKLEEHLPPLECPVCLEPGQTQETLDLFECTVGELHTRCLLRLPRQRRGCMKQGCRKERLEDHYHLEPDLLQQLANQSTEDEDEQQ